MQQGLLGTQGCHLLQVTSGYTAPEQVWTEQRRDGWIRGIRFVTAKAQTTVGTVLMTSVKLRGQRQQHLPLGMSESGLWLRATPQSTIYLFIIFLTDVCCVFKDFIVLLL